MGFVETELHKLDLRVAALEGKKHEDHLKPHSDVFQHSSVQLPSEAVIEEEKPKHKGGK